MDHAAIDLHKKESQIRIVTEAGEVLDRRVPTSRAAFTAVFGSRPGLRVLVEASTESEWVAQHLETLGHEVVVADPNYAPMYGTRSRRIKTDLRDTVALADACRQGTYRATHRRSAPQRVRQWELSVRDQLVRTRTRAIAGVRAITRSVGARLPRTTSARLAAHLEALALPPDARTALQPLCDLITHTATAQGTCDARLAELAAADLACRRLMTAPGVGPVTAVAYVAAIDDPRRFRSASQVAQYLGLVPRETSSGERQRRGHVVRAAQPRVQRLLVQAAWRILRSPQPKAVALRAWGTALAERRGRRIAVVAIARRLARLLGAMWRDETDFRAASPRDKQLEE
jgi:transposase